MMVNCVVNNTINLYPFSFVGGSASSTLKSNYEKIFVQFLWEINFNQNICVHNILRNQKKKKKM